MLFELYVSLASAFWILFPAYAANCFPLLTRVLKIRPHPIDSGKYFKGNRLFGEGKTWEGFGFGLIAGFLVGLLELSLYPMLNSYANQFNVSLPQITILIAFLIPFGALTGDLIKSFFKRRFGKERGAEVIVFDQLDFVAGVILFTFFLVDYTLAMIAIMFIATFIIHKVASVIGYWIKVKREPW